LDQQEIAPEPNNLNATPEFSSKLRAADGRLFSIVGCFGKQSKLLNDRPHLQGYLKYGDIVSID